MRRFFPIITALFFAAQSHAYEPIQNVYEAMVPLSDRSDTALNEAISLGLEQVLIRYTGYSAIANISGVVTELNAASRYVIEYGVETIESKAEDNIGRQELDALWIKYNAGLVDQLVHDLALSIWPTLRPTVSYTVVTELWNEPRVPTVEEYPALWLHLDTIFKQRGLIASKLERPASLNVSAEALWNMDQDTADKLRRQSKTDVIAVVRIGDGYDGNYELDFLFMDEASETLLKKRDADLMSGLSKGIQSYIDELSLGLAFLGGMETESDFYIQVEGVRAYSEYKTLLNQIAGLEQVISARMDNATDSGVGFLIRFQSNMTMLMDSIQAITGVIPINRLGDEGDGRPVFRLPGESADNPVYFQYPNSTFYIAPEDRPSDNVKEAPLDASPQTFDPAQDSRSITYPERVQTGESI